MLLLTGPPGSGKTHYILERFRERLRCGAEDARLLVPTATMAEHLRNALAREGFLLRPSRIATLSKFIEPWAGDRPQASPALMQLLAQKVLARIAPPEFSGVLSLPGFQAAVVNLVDEFSSSGCDARRLGELLRDDRLESRFGRAFQTVFAGVEADVAGRGLSTRTGRLHQAAQSIRSGGLPGVREVFIDGFFSFTGVEVELIGALGGHAQVVVTLPSWHGAEAAREAFRRAGFEEKRFERVRARPRQILFAAPTLDQEVEEIARRILEQAASGRPFREIGIVVRSSAPYVPALRTALERFGIPARYYFAESLARHGAMRRLGGVVDAMLGGWDHGETLAALRLGAAGEALDSFEMLVRERLPGRGLDGLRKLRGDYALQAVFDSLQRLEAWRTLVISPKQWAEELKTLRVLFPPPVISDGVSGEKVLLWRNLAGALDAFEAAMGEAALALEAAGGMPLAEFWKAAKSVLRETSLRIPDHRRNVVHVLDVYEARQWELPVVFVCGMLEKQFPLYHPQNPIFPDEDRLRLRSAGYSLPTSAEKQREERFLFEMAASRATELLVLSYPSFNSRGDANLPSFLLEEHRSATPVQTESCRPARPRPAWEPAAQRSPVVYNEELREWLGKKHATLAPTSIENFLQCPFQFFGRHTLGLREPPAAERDRLDMLVQGRIIHRVLAELQRAAQPLEALFEGVFEEECARARVPRGYRMEAVRLEMLRSLKAFLEDARLPEAGEVRTELKFDLTVEDGLTIRGRIDRLDIHAGGRALVIDYKYSPPDRIEENIKEHEQGMLVQGGLYLLAARDVFGCEPAGMLYGGVRREARWDGWHTPLAGLERVGESCTPAVLAELVERATEQSRSAARQIREGRVEPDPHDADKCRFCAYGDVCRVESRAAVTVAGGLPR